MVCLACVFITLSVAIGVGLHMLHIPRWLRFSHHNVSSAAVSPGNTMFNLSGVIDVLLFLIVRPQLFLFPRPEKLAELDMELVRQGSGSPILSDIAKFQHNPELTWAAPMVNEGSREQYRAIPRQF
jgi:hypothetical protein